MEIWKTLRVSHISTPPTATTNYCLKRRYTNIPLGTKDRSDQGQTPSQTMKAKLSIDILKKGTDSLFKRSEKGRFALREWAGIQEHVADRFTKALFDEDIVVFPTALRSAFIPLIGLYDGRLDSQALLAECYPMRRRLAEEDPSVIQLVSVFIVRHESKYLTYKRTKR